MKLWAIVLGLCAVGLAQSASAGTFGYMGSIACDTTSDVCGFAYDLLTRQSVAEAMEICRSRGGVHCKIAMTSFDSCGAVTRDANGVGGYGIGMTKELAISRAMNACMADGSRGCHLDVWLCTPEGSTGGGAPPPRPPYTPTQPTKPTPGCPYGSHAGLGGCYAY